MKTDMDKVEIESPSSNIELSVQQKILQRHYDLQKEFKKRKEKGEDDVTGIDQIEQFLDVFTMKQNDIEKGIKLAEEGSVNKNDLVSHLNVLNKSIQELQNFYSNSIIFLRIYDKKKCQAVLQTLHNNLQDLECKLLPKKKFGFKSRKNKTENGVRDVKYGEDITDHCVRLNNIKLSEFCGFRNRENEVLIMKDAEVDRKDILLTNLHNCTVKILGSPNTLHIADIDSCSIFCGPVSTSIMVEKCKNSKFYLACQQLRIHETFNVIFHLHVTSKAIIEDSKNVKFGSYNFVYKNLDRHFEISKLNRFVNNWDKVDDFNWLASDKPSPNWSRLEDSEIVNDGDS